MPKILIERNQIIKDELNFKPRSNYFFNKIGYCVFYSKIKREQAPIIKDILEKNTQMEEDEGAQSRVPQALRPKLSGFTTTSFL